MPKKNSGVRKPNKSAAKRFRASGTRVRCRAAFRSHNLGKQNTTRRKRKIGGQVVNTADIARVKEMLQQ